MIPFVREKEKVPLSNFLNVAIKLPSAFPEEFQDLNLAFVSQTQAGSITTRIQPLLAQSSAGEAILLDFDFAKGKELDIRHIETYIDESHRHTKEMFEQIITENYLKYIKGETV